MFEVNELIKILFNINCLKIRLRKNRSTEYSNFNMKD